MSNKKNPPDVYEILLEKIPPLPEDFIDRLLDRLIEIKDRALAKLERIKARWNRTDV